MKHFLSGFLLVAVLLLTTIPLPGQTKDATLSAKDHARLRREAAHRPRRIIQNFDGNDATFQPKSGPLPQALLNIFLSGLENTQVDSVFYCTHWSFSTVIHRSKIATVLTSKTAHPSLTNSCVAELIAMGTDPLEVVGDFCRQHDLEFFCSFRMNDIHDGAVDPSGKLVYPHLFSEFKRDHPEYLLGKVGERLPGRPYGSRSACGVDYGIPEVRDHLFRMVEEVVQSHDLDGVELDFFRHTIFFLRHAREGRVGTDEREQMTNLVRRIRKMFDREGRKRGRPILLSIRVPDSVGFCRDIGLDIERWLQEDLVDLLMPSGYFRLTPWSESVALGQKHDVPVYANLSEARVMEKGFKRDWKRYTAEAFRARALRAWNAGVNGIYTYNIFYFFRTEHPIWNELGDPNALAGRDKLYVVNTLRTDMIDGFLPGAQKRYRKLPILNQRSPMKLRSGATRHISLIVDDDLQESQVRLHLMLDDAVGTAMSEVGESLSVVLNGRPLTEWRAKLETKYAARAKSGPFTDNYLEYDVPSAFVRTGENRFEFTLHKSTANELRLRDLQLWISYRR